MDLQGFFTQNAPIRRQLEEIRFQEQKAIYEYVDTSYDPNAKEPNIFDHIRTARSFLGKAPEKESRASSRQSVSGGGEASRGSMSRGGMSVSGHGFAGGGTSSSSVAGNSVAGGSSGGGGGGGSIAGATRGSSSFQQSSVGTPMSKPSSLSTGKNTERPSSMMENSSKKVSFKSSK
jgi:hypothetical protein